METTTFTVTGNQKSQFLAIGFMGHRIGFTYDPIGEDKFQFTIKTEQLNDAETLFSLFEINVTQNKGSQ